MKVKNMVLKMRKSIFSLLVLLLALFLAVGAVSAEDLAADDSSDLAQEAPVSPSLAASEEAPVADIDVVVENFYETDEVVTWEISSYNYGPDTAPNTVVKVIESSNLQWLGFYTDNGTYNGETGIWEIGDLPAGEIVFLYLTDKKVGEGPYYLLAVASSDADDPYPDDNVDMGVAGVVEEVSATEETLPATGNPLAVALLALLAVGVGGIKRRF